MPMSDFSDQFADWKNDFEGAFYQYKTHDSDARRVFENARCPVCSGPMRGDSPWNSFSRVCSGCNCRVECDVEEIEVQNSCYTQHLRGIKVFPAKQ